MIQSNEFYKKLENYLQGQYGKCPEQADAYELYNGLSCCILELTRSSIDESVKRQSAAGKQAFVISAEYAPSVPLMEAAQALGLEEVLKEVLCQAGATWADLDGIDEMKLGRSGEAQYASSLLEAAATGGYPLGGFGLRYEYGYFKQTIRDGFQIESEDDWSSHGDPWSLRREEEAILVPFPGEPVWAIPYDMPIYGYGTDYVSTLRLFKSEPVEKFDWQAFQEGRFDESVARKNRAEDITRLLYPRADNPAGEKLYLKQMYFLASASVQDLVRRYTQKYGRDFSHLEESYAIQLNDSFPVLAIPELIRILMDEYHLEFVPAFYIAKNVFSYTNYTVTPKFEFWCREELLKEVAPPIYYIVLMMNEHLIRELSSRQVRIGQIREMKPVAGGRVSMLKLAAYSCHSINGVSLEKWKGAESVLLESWHTLYPKRFISIAGGVSQRQWLAHANRSLAAFLTKELKTTDWITDFTLLGQLKEREQDPALIAAFQQTKREQKASSSQYFFARDGYLLSPDHLYDMQLKRISASERQLLNAFCIYWIYLDLKEGRLEDFTPTTFLIGGKAGSGDPYAKGVLKYICELAERIQKDPDVAGKLAFYFVEDLGIHLREKLVPAADVAVQLAIKNTEATALSNIQFIINGAVSLGTPEGCKVGVSGEPARKMNYVFGRTLKEADQLRADYNPRILWEENPMLRRVVDSLIDGTFTDEGADMFKKMYALLLEGDEKNRPDSQMILLDLPAFVKCRLQANGDFLKNDFSKRGFYNVCHADHYSADHTVRDYSDFVWDISKVSCEHNEKGRR